ncbi:hypothetical protein BCON_0194g00020 [Botryotinia convoluta]|uniref:FAD-binding domain-containing protein n=1 Tax=Botryotinia convoluta TaxID=54673 RepID=A0A4Z1HRX9_9HELO|nr:hypothetical protein BCON_0194g00020 [Botryotinia convoluta]
MDLTRETISKVDVLVIGAGPAGFMAATWMARCGINARIIDKRGTKIFTSQADGLQCRTLEILDSFGFADGVWKESNHMLEICLWNPDSEGKLRRSDRTPDTIPGISRFQQVVLHQVQFFLNSLEEHSNIKVERGIFPYTLAFDETKAEDPNEYPIEVVLQHLTDDQINPRQSQATRDGAATSDGLFRSNIAADDDTDEVLSDAHENELTVINETVKAKYLIGCDDYEHCDWWTAYQIGQRVASNFSQYDRMNVSMQDTYNLGWKIAAVLNGTANRSMLRTFSRLFSGRPAKDIMDEEGISMEEFKDAFEKGNLFASGVSVNYGASIIVAKEDDAAAQGYEIGVTQNINARVIGKEHLATNIKIGMRMPSFKVLN